MINTFVPKIDFTISIGSIATFLCVIFSLGLCWGKFNSAIDEVKLMRVQDISRIEKIEIKTSTLEDRVVTLDRNHAVIHNDIQYIKEGIQNIQNTLKNK